MQIEIKLRGPAGCGKTQLSHDLAKVITELAPEGSSVVIESTNYPKPKGIDTTPTDVWNREYEFDVGA